MKLKKLLTGLFFVGMVLSLSAREIDAMKSLARELLKDVLLHKKRAIEFLEAGTNLRKKQVSETDNVADPLFFYIIRGMLNDSLRVLIPNEN